MEIYILLALSVIFSIVIHEYGYDVYLTKNISVVGLSVLFIFIVFYSIREGIGYDYEMYKGYIYNASLVGIDAYANRGELLSAILLNVALELDDYHIFFMLVSIISIPLIFLSIIENSKVSARLGWGLLVFLVLPIGLVGTLSAQRQFLGMAVLLYGIKYIIAKKIIKYMICVVIASMFHMSSVLAIIYYIVAKDRFKYKYFVFILLLLLGCIYGMESILIEFYPQLGIYLMNSDWSNQGGQFQLLLYLFFALVFFILKENLKNYTNYEIILKIYLVGVVMTCVIYPIANQVSFRVCGSALLSLMILFPYIFYIFEKKYRGLIKCLVSVLLLGLYFYALYITEGKAYIPYNIMSF